MYRLRHIFIFTYISSNLSNCKCFAKCFVIFNKSYYFTFSACGAWFGYSDFPMVKIEFSWSRILLFWDWIKPCCFFRALSHIAGLMQTCFPLRCIHLLEQTRTPRQDFFRMFTLWLFVLRMAHPEVCFFASSQFGEYT